MREENLNLFFGRLIVDHLVRCGVKQFCLSPGSRSTPLAAAALRHESTETEIILDERAAGFYAVGYARASGRPAVVVCTSGTAAANYFPAIIEASQSRLPLIVITADRPSELQNCGANQTINQENLYGQYVFQSLVLEAPNEDGDPAAVLNRLDKALQLLLSGPVHINCRFREPLAPAECPYDYERGQKQIDNWYLSHEKSAKRESDSSLPSVIGEVAKKINSHRRGLIIAGAQNPQEKVRGIEKLGKLLGWPVVADVLSQSRFGRNGKNILGLYDLYLAVPEMAKSLAPEIILHLGGLPVSKYLNRFLLENRGIDYIKVQNHDKVIDPDRLETERIIMQPGRFIDALMPHLQKSTDVSYYESWNKTEEDTSQFLAERFNNDALTEPALVWAMNNVLSSGEALFLSNSMPVRDADSLIFGRDADIIVGGNRGVSGIDGIIASASGFAAGCCRPTILLIGDLAFIHDLNSLQLAAQSKHPIIIIVTNNNGGGIFHFLPVAHFSDIFEKGWGTPHDLTFEAAATLFGLDYHHPSSIKQLRLACSEARQNRRSSIIEITGDRCKNFEEHEAIRSALRQFLLFRRRD